MSPRGIELNAQLRAEALAKISAAALAEFADFGYHGAAVKRIARKAGLSYGLVYHYFPAKADIFRHLVDCALESTLAAMRAVLDGPGTAWQKIASYAELIVASAFSGESARYFFIMLQAVTQGKSVPGLPEQIERRTAAYFEILAPVIAQAQASGEAAPGDPAVLAAAFFAFLQGLSLFTFHRKGLERQVTADILLSVLRNPRSRTKP